MANPISYFYELIAGYQASQVLYVVAKFQFAEFLKDGPKSGEEVAKLANTSEEHTCRLLRAASGLGIFARDTESLKYSLNDLSSALLEGPASLRYSALSLGGAYVQQGWLNLEKTVEGGVNGFKEAHGVSFFDYLKAHPDASNIFNRAMTGFSTAISPAHALSTQYGFSDVQHLVDIGGGHGFLTVEILRANPHLRGTNFDLPHVIDEAKEKKPEHWEAVKSRFEYASGNFFESVPHGADVYLLKSIIHDWEEAKAIQILKTLRSALPDHGKIVLVEQILKETGDVAGALLDLHMMVILNSRERTEAEYRKLLDKAELTLSRVVALSPGVYSAIEAVKKIVS
eukprot:Phypoly_transcript_12312.p1 GENE.Phypoly_transcript_12312~~Phypoly_transcript_12312.p1  ORF type:complete len:342 (+),score=44.39 Phypoly_transcript_12312:86-1111(+)